MKPRSQVATAPTVFERVGTALPAVLAVVFGAFLIFGAGFAHPTTLHNAAHDGRHSFAFPCH
jgi:cobalt transporter subunit CbtB